MKRLFCIFTFLFVCVFGAFCENDFSYNIESYGKQIKCYVSDNGHYVVMVKDYHHNVYEVRYAIFDSKNYATKLLYEIKKECMSGPKIRLDCLLDQIVDKELEGYDFSEEYTIQGTTPCKTLIYDVTG